MPDNLLGNSISAPYFPKEVKWKYTNKNGVLRPKVKFGAITDGADGKVAVFPPVPDPHPRIPWPEFPPWVPWGLGPCPCLYPIPDAHWGSTITTPSHMIRLGEYYDYVNPPTYLAISTEDGINWEVLKSYTSEYMPIWMSVYDYNRTSNLYYGTHDTFFHQYLVAGPDLDSLVEIEILPEGWWWTGNVSYIESLAIYMVFVGNALSPSNPCYLSFSTNGVDWSASPIAMPAGTWGTPVYSPELGMFISYGAGVTNRNYAYSYDGANWTVSTILTPPAYWNNCCWSSTLGLWLLTGPENGSLSTGGMVFALSSDGINWDVYFDTTIWGGYDGIFWATELNMFIGNSDSNAGIMFSYNGITWTVSNDCPLPVEVIYPNWKYWPEKALYFQFGDVATGGFYINQKYSIWP